MWKPLANLTLVLGAAASLGALWLSIRPGVLQDLALMVVYGSVLWVPLFVLVAVVLLVQARRGKLAPSDLPWGRAMAATAILLATLVLLAFYVPRRVAFRMSKDAFDALLAQAPTPEEGTIPLQRSLGLYPADVYATDPRGGLYVRVHTSSSGPDQLSYGFAHEPNPQGTPFGAASYRYRSLGQGWYWFAVSNDK